MFVIFCVNAFIIKPGCGLKHAWKQNNYLALFLEDFVV